MAIPLDFPPEEALTPPEYLGSAGQTLAALLGHSDLNTTRRYTTPSADDLAQVVEGMGGVCYNVCVGS